MALLLALLAQMVASEPSASVNVLPATAEVKRIPGSLAATSNGFVLAWAEKGPHRVTDCYLAILDAVGRVTASRKLVADGCESIRAAWSGGRIGVAFYAKAAAYQPGRSATRGWFQIFDAGLEPLGPAVEAVEHPSSVWGAIVWNHDLREWAVAWTTFNPRPGSARLLRFSSSGQPLPVVELARGPNREGGSSPPSVYHLAAVAKGYRAVFSGSLPDANGLRLVSWDAGGVGEDVALDADGWQATVLAQGDATWVAWQSQRSTVLRWARIDGAGVVERASARELQGGATLGWLSLQGGGQAPLLAWHEVSKSGVARSMLVELHAGVRHVPTRIGQSDMGAFFPVVARAGARVAVVWAGGASFESASGLWFTWVPDA